MANYQMTEINIASTKNIYKNGRYIDDDLLLFDSVSDVPMPDEPRRIRCLLMALCTKGEAEYTVDTEKHIVKANDIIIISEGQVTDNFKMSKDCQGIALMLSKEFFNQVIADVHELSSLFLFSRNHPVCNLNTEEVETIVDYFKLIKRKVDDEKQHFRKDTVRMLITTMILDLSNVIYKIQQNSNIKQTRAESIFTKFIELVEQNFRKERRVGWYGQQLCITPKYLSETVKQVSHRTPNEWIDNYVILEIRVLLRNSNKSIKEITSELNFPNQSFLGKFFKEHIGKSPSEYRGG
jgi:YesN/AraC family two-component response regulator